MVNHIVDMLNSRSQITPSNSRPSRRWRGTTVTVSISARKAISEAVMPRGSGKAIFGGTRQQLSVQINQIEDSRVELIVYRHSLMFLLTALWWRRRREMRETTPR